ncbi:hypothetical protein SERLA73DRAFT_36961, partial [Serpula lacrymans var. lacrymans S7.3]
KATRWAHIQLPNGQVACSSWKEDRMTIVRVSRNVKFDSGDHIEVGEVLFYFQLKINGIQKSVALVSLYSPPDQQLLHMSSGSVWLSEPQGNCLLKVIDVKTILGVVAMVPYSVMGLGQSQGRFLLVEKTGLDL